MHVMEITADYRTGFVDKMRINHHMRYIVQPYQICLHIQGICFRDRSATEWQWQNKNTDNKNND